MTAKGFLFGILIGGIVGAVTALLLAPMEGAETRRRIADTSKSAKDKVAQAATNVKKRVKREPEAALKQSM